MNNQKTKSIRVRIILLIVVSVFILSAVLLGMLVYAVRNVGNEESAIAEEKLLEQVKSGLKASVLSVVENSASQ